MGGTVANSEEMAPAVPEATISGLRQAQPSSTPMALQFYKSMMEFVLKPDTAVREASFQEAQRMLADFAPRDAVEEMLAAQLLWTHGRLAHLSFYAVVQTTKKNIRVFHELANSTLNASRRLIETLSLYRHPDGKRFVAVRQANIAQHQVVHNAGRGKKKSAHLPGGSKSRGRGKNVQRIAATISASSPSSALPSLAAGPGLPAPARPPEPAVGEEHRPQDDSGEACLQPKLS